MIINSVLDSGFPLHKQYSENSFIVNPTSDGSTTATTLTSEVGESLSDISNITATMDAKLENEMELPWYGHAICITTMLFIWVVGSVGNFLVIYVVCKEKQLQTPINMFLVNLSMADFMTSSLGSPLPLVASILQKWPFGETMCTVYAFGMSLGGITSITTLMVLAFERYLMIARPFRASDIRVYHSSALILLIWSYSLALTLPPLFGWASYGPEGPYISCSVSWEKDDLATKTYICFLFILGFVIPLITIIFAYIGIVTTIKSTSQTQSCTRTATGRAELRVTAMVGVMIGCFLIAWVPYAIVSLIVSFGGPRQRQLITPVVSVLPAIFAKSSTCYNPIIYVGLNTQFQNAWMKVFGIKREDMEIHTCLTASVGAPTTVAAPTYAKSATLAVCQVDHSISIEEMDPVAAANQSLTRCQENTIVVSSKRHVDEGNASNNENAIDGNELNVNKRTINEFELHPIVHNTADQEEESNQEESSSLLCDTNRKENIESTFNEIIREEQTAAEDCSLPKDSQDSTERSIDAEPRRD